MIHRDIKPQNIWLESEPGAGAGRCRRCKILDFGLARAVDEDAGPDGAGLAVGSPAYMSPEQARGRPLDAADRPVQPRRGALPDDDRAATVRGVDPDGRPDRAGPGPAEPAAGRAVVPAGPGRPDPPAPGEGPGRPPGLGMRGHRDPANPGGRGPVPFPHCRDRGSLPETPDARGAGRRARRGGRTPPRPGGHHHDSPPRRPKDDDRSP